MPGEGWLTGRQMRLRLPYPHNTSCASIRLPVRPPLIFPLPRMLGFHSAPSPPFPVVTAQCCASVLSGPVFLYCSCLLLFKQGRENRERKADRNGGVGGVNRAAKGKCMWIYGQLLGEYCVQYTHVGTCTHTHTCTHIFSSSCL